MLCPLLVRFDSCVDHGIVQSTDVWVGPHSPRCTSVVGMCVAHRISDRALGSSKATRNRQRCGAGTPFDPEVHDGVMREENDDVPDGQVCRHCSICNPKK